MDPAFLQQLQHHFGLALRPAPSDVMEQRQHLLVQGLEEKLRARGYRIQQPGEDPIALGFGAQRYYRMSSAEATLLNDAQHGARVIERMQDTLLEQLTSIEELEVALATRSLMHVKANEERATGTVSLNLLILVKSHAAIQEEENRIRNVYNL